MRSLRVRVCVCACVRVYVCAVVRVFACVAASAAWKSKDIAFKFQLGVWVERNLPHCAQIHKPR